MPDIYYKPDGTECTSAQWIGYITAPDRYVELAAYTVGGDQIMVHSYYSGLDHRMREALSGGANPLIFSVSVNGNATNPAHADWHGHDEEYATQAEAHTEFLRVKAELEELADG